MTRAAFGGANNRTGPPGDREQERILGLDVGEKRIGVAVSDPLGISAQGLAVLIRQGRDADLVRLQEMIRQYPIKEIVVGLPRHMDGRLGEQAPAILDLARELGEALGAAVIPWDERLSTVEAERVLVAADLSRRRRRQVVDKLAAVLILQGYLNSRDRGE
jgi:putative Holliday junction resolvase